MDITLACFRHCFAINNKWMVDTHFFLFTFLTRFLSLSLCLSISSIYFTSFLAPLFTRNTVSCRLTLFIGVFQSECSEISDERRVLSVANVVPPEIQWFRCKQFIGECCEDWWDSRRRWQLNGDIGNKKMFGSSSVRNRTKVGTLLHAVSTATTAGKW